MENKCICDNPGWCERHKMQKVGRLFDICKLDNDLGARYRKLWDEKVAEKEFAPVAQQAVSFFKSLAKHMMNGFKYASDDEYKRRLEICNECESNRNDRCVECGCFVSIKAKWASEECPLRKWMKFNDDKGCGCGS